MAKYKFIDKALFFPREKILVISDLHIGFEESLREAGLQFPLNQFDKIKENMKKIFEEVGNKLGKEKKEFKDKREKQGKNKKISKINEIIILGDLKHEFGKISRQEWQETLEFLELIEKYVKKIILIKGNHDNILGVIAKQKNLEVKDYYIKDGICFLHGHKLYAGCLDKNNKIKMFVIGHRHPAVTLHEGVKSERYKCFLVGKWKGKEVIILPSMFPLIEGSDIVNENESNMAFNFDYNQFEVYVVSEEGKIYDFGKLGKLNLL